MQGCRLPDGVTPRQPGEYAWMPYSLWEHRPPFFLGDGEWHLIAPNGHMGAYCRSTVDQPTPAHTCEIHEDGSVTFHPSIVMPRGWHGFLVRGVWE